MQSADPGAAGVRWLGWLLLALVGSWYVWEPSRVRPVPLVADSMPRPASRADLPSPPGAPDGEELRLAFLGDLMEQREQTGDDFEASYAQVAAYLRGMDLAVANLEFPVDTTLPPGPDPGTVRFNGSASHLDALAGAGIDVLQTANNHCFDRGLPGMLRTLEVVEGRGLRVAGTARTLEELRERPLLVTVKKVSIAFRAYTIPPNAYLDAEGQAGWPPRDLPVFGLDFDHWQGDDRAQGVALFREHVRQARQAGAKLLVALVHWGKEYYLRPTADQRRAAHDLIDAGFDLVVGSHSHVLNGAEVYRGKVIAYSLGNFMSRGLRFETSVGAVLEVVVAAESTGTAVVTDFVYRPVRMRRRGHVVIPVDSAVDGEGAAAWAFARRVLGASLTRWD